MKGGESPKWLCFAKREPEGGGKTPNLGLTRRAWGPTPEMASFRARGSGNESYAEVIVS